VFGGAIPTPLTITQIYDPGTNTWTTGPSMNFARLWFYGGAIDDSSIVAPGGDNPPGVQLNVNEQFTGSWATKAPLPYLARGPFAVSDGTFVYIGGGYEAAPFTQTRCVTIRWLTPTRRWRLHLMPITCRKRCWFQALHAARRQLRQLRQQQLRI